MPEYTQQTHTMTTWDGTKLFYRSWIPKEPYAKAVLLFHRGHEHSERLDDLVRQLNLDGFACFAWDARGNGESPGRRDWAESFSVYVKDADAFARHIATEHGVPINQMAIVANSVGAMIATTWVHDFAPPIKALVLATPALRIKLYLPLAIPLLRLGLKLGLVKNVPSYVKGSVLTHDKKEQQAFAEDEKITHGISTNILLDVHDTATRIIQDAGAIRVPTQMHVAGKDWVVKIKPQRHLFDSLWSRDKEWHYYPGFFHAIFHEKERQAAIDHTHRFIKRVFDENHRQRSLRSADQSGFTKLEFDILKQPSSNLIYAANRIGLNTVAKLSKGVQIGHRDGFDSGVTLDYVYENKPQGITPIGKLIDHSYLNSIGWRGIRQRRVHLQATLTTAIEEQSAENKLVHIVDIASGPGRYVMDTLQTMGNKAESVTATLRDYKSVNVQAGQQLAKQMDVQDRVKHDIGDAFNFEQLSKLSPRPTIGIVSGLYELFSDNLPIQNSLRGLAEAIEPGNLLIYTNQPWHPQVQYIARVLKNREGEPWIMRRRTQEEMDTLVREAGFEKLGMEIDQWGIFTVSLARRIRA